MEIEGKNYGTSSVTKGLARHRMASKPQEPAAGGGNEDMGGGASDQDHGGEEGGHEVIQQVQSEHGPAHTVETKKEGEHHTVATTHEDGHKHTSKGHPSVAHVHEHIGHAIGKGQEEAPAEHMESDGGSSLEAMGVGAEE